MNGVLIIAHGSRKNEHNYVFDEIVSMVSNSLQDEYIVEGAFISMSNIVIEDSLLSLIKKGVKSIKIVPYLLFSGNYAVSIIPSKVSEFMKNYDNIEVSYCEPFGADVRLADIIVDKVIKVEEDIQSGIQN